MDTDTWAAITKTLVDRAIDPVKQVINDSKISFDQLDEVEVVGSATRSPLVQAALKDFLGNLLCKALRPKLLMYLNPGPLIYL